MGGLQSQSFSLRAYIGGSTFKNQNLPVILRSIFLFSNLDKAFYLTLSDMASWDVIDSYLTNRYYKGITSRHLEEKISTKS